MCGGCILLWLMQKLNILCITSFRWLPLPVSTITSKANDDLSSCFQSSKFLSPLYRLLQTKPCPTIVNWYFCCMNCSRLLWCSHTCKPSFLKALESDVLLCTDWKLLADLSLTILNFFINLKYWLSFKTSSNDIGSLDNFFWGFLLWPDSGLFLFRVTEDYGVEIALSKAAGSVAWTIYRQLGHWHNCLWPC